MLSDNPANIPGVRCKAANSAGPAMLQVRRSRVRGPVNKFMSVLSVTHLNTPNLLFRASLDHSVINAHGGNTDASVSRRGGACHTSLAHTVRHGPMVSWSGPPPKTLGVENSEKLSASCFVEACKRKAREVPARTAGGVAVCPVREYARWP